MTPVCPAPQLIRLKPQPVKGSSGYDIGSVTVSFAALDGGALGQTTGANVTLDTSASGYNWFIDQTPADNSEFLPTANPNEWIAKADSEAAGKMDMLSVLLHEYGHALGIDHSSDPNDFMGTTLTPGVRRLPSTEELALMAQLAGEIKSDMTADSNTPDSPQSPLPSIPLGGAFGLALLGRLRSTRYGGWSIAVDSATQYDIVANPTFTNSQLQSTDGWSTTGSVAIANGAAVLSETATSQTRLNQVFVVGESDRFLSFTLANIALDDQNAAPDDAFEAALLDANTGLSLLGGTGLTHNDAFLNLQADGSERAASGITSIRNADGSRTYLVDLAGIPAGTAVNLSFDLLGFGQGAAATSSHLTIRDLRIGVPQTTDDSVTLAEDTPTTIAALANDLNAQQPGFVPVLVDAPAHGQVTINADGTFNFAPDKDWNGEDRFTYKLSDGHVDSNLATVSLTVTPVNDAPVTANDAASVSEDGTLAASGNLLANDSDVDTGTVLTVAAPGDYVGTYGTLNLALDGSYSYTLANDSNVVQALRAGEVVTDIFTYAASDGITSTPAQLTVTVTGQNDAPVMVDDTASVSEDGALVASGNLLANDSDVDANTVLTIAAPSSYVGTYGTLTMTEDGSYSYALANDSSIVQALREGEIVSDVFAYAASDGLTSTPATLTVTIAGTNDAPVTANDAASVQEDGTLVASGNLLANDSDVDADTVLTVAAPSTQLSTFAGAYGTLLVNSDGWYSYTLANESPAVQGLRAGQVVADVFVYEATDGIASTPATLTIQITGANDGPLTHDDLGQAREDGGPVVLDAGTLLANDADADIGDSKTLVAVTDSAAGAQVHLIDGQVVYDVASLFQSLKEGEATTDSFTYTMVDGAGATSTATVTMTIVGANDAPVAQDDSATLLEDGRITLALMSKASDIDGDALTLRIVDQPAHGILTLNADNTVTYVPTANYNGEDAFTYLVNDGRADLTIKLKKWGGIEVAYRHCSY